MNDNIDRGLSVNGLGLYPSPTKIMIAENSDIEDEETEGEWYMLDTIMVRANKRPNWFHRKMLKLMFGINYIIGKRTK